MGRGGRLALAVLVLGGGLVVAPAATRAQFGDLFGGGGSEELGEFDWSDMDSWSSATGSAEIIARRIAANTAAVAANIWYSLLGMQIKNNTEHEMQTNFQWEMLKLLAEDQTGEAITVAGQVRDHQGSHGVAWEAGGAETQHYFAFVEPAGTDLENLVFTRGHLGEITGLQTASGRELAQVIAEQSEGQREDMRTLERMVEESQGVPGVTAAVQALTQVTALMVAKLDAMQSVDGALAKFMLADKAGDHMERRNALQQRAFDSRDTMGGVDKLLGWPGYEIGSGGAGNVGDKHDQFLTEDPFVGTGF